MKDVGADDAPGAGGVGPLAGRGNAGGRPAKQAVTDEQIEEMWKEKQYDELVECLKGIAISAAERHYFESLRNTEVDLDEVISWALEALCKAINSWDPSRGAPLRGYVVYSIPNAIKNIQRDAVRQKRGGGLQRVPFECLDTDGSNTDEPYDGEAYRPDTNRRLAQTMSSVKAEASARIEAIDIEAAMESLPERQRQILLGLAQGATRRELGEKLGISHVTVHKDAEKARAKMRELLA